MQTQIVLSGKAGYKGLLDDCLGKAMGSRVLLVAGQSSFRASGAEEVMSDALSGCCVSWFSGFSANPKVDEVEKALQVVAAAGGADAIVAVGGGSAMDVAKMVHFFSSAGVSPSRYLAGDRPTPRLKRPLLAVPTTAGSGSEATHFAVLYEGMMKHSVAHECLLPSHVWLNPDFTLSLPPYQTACSGFDALAQGIESYWAVGSSSESRADALRAVVLCVEHLEGAVLDPGIRNRTGMMEAAHLAGRAINVSKTTAAHAMSYPLTAHYGLPHGHALATVLPEVFQSNAWVQEHDLADARGVAHVRGTISRLCEVLGGHSTEETVAGLRSLTGRIGLSNKWMASRGISVEEARRHIAEEVNEERLGNNPRRLNRAVIEGILGKVF